MLTTDRARELERPVKTAAIILGRRTGLQEDEARQEIWMGILETAQRRGPEFLEQKPSYIVQGGVFWARNEWRKRQAKKLREVPEEAGLSRAGDADPSVWMASKEYLIEVMRALAGDTVAKALVAGVLRGEKKRVIARRAGVSPQAISLARRRVQSAMMDK